MAIPLTRITLDGILKLHDIGYDITSADGVRVYVKGVSLDSPVDYSVIGSTDELREGKGKIELVNAYQSGDVLVIIRDTEEARVTNFAKAARFEEKEIDNEFDNYLRLLEDALMYLQATPHFSPDQIGLIDGEMPPGAPGAVIRLNDAGTGFDFVKVEDFPKFDEAIQKAKDEADRSEQKANESAQSATASEQSNQSSANHAETSRKWAEGETPSGDQPSDANNSKHWSEEAKKEADRVPSLLAGKIDKVGGDNGAARIPAGTEAQKPNTSSEALALIRLSKELGFVGFNPFTKEWGSLGGGMVRPIKPDVSEYPYVAKKGRSILVDVKNDISRVVKIPSGWSVGDFVIVSLWGWSGSPSVTCRIEADPAQEWEHPSMSAGDSIAIKGNQFVGLQVVEGGALKVVECGGESQSVEKKYPTEWLDASSFLKGGVIVSAGESFVYRWDSSDTIRLAGIIRKSSGSFPSSMDVLDLPSANGLGIAQSRPITTLTGVAALATLKASGNVVGISSVGSSDWVALECSFVLKPL